MKNTGIIFFICVAVAYWGLPVSAQSVFEQNKYNLESSSPAVRVAAVEYFKAQGSLEANNVLLERVKAEKNIGMKLRLIEAVNVNISSEAFKTVASLLSDPNPAVGQSAAISLGACSDPEALIPVFEKTLKDRNSPARVKQSVVNVLGLHVSTGSIRLLDSVAASTANPAGMRQLAVYSMGRMETKEAAEKVKRYVNDKNAAVSGEAKKAGASKKSK